MIKKYHFKFLVHMEQEDMMMNMSKKEMIIWLCSLDSKEKPGVLNAISKKN